MKILIYIIIFFGSILFSNDINYNMEDIDENDNKKLLDQYYNKKKEFIIILKTGEKYKVSEIISVEGDNYKLNILNKRLSENILYENNMNQNSKLIKEVKLSNVLMVESINYDKQIKEIRNYSFIIIGMYLIFSAFSS